MSLKLRIGRGLRGDDFAGRVLEAEIDKGHATWTLEQLGRLIAKQIGIVDGEIEMKNMTIAVHWKPEKKS